MSLILVQTTVTNFALGIEKLIRVISTYSALLPILMGSIAFFKNKLSYPVRWIFILSVTSLSFDFSSLQFAKYFGNNMPFVHAYIFIESVFLIFYFKSIVRKNHSIIYLGIILLFFQVANSFFLGSIYTFNTLGMMIEALIGIYFALVFFYQVYLSEQVIFLDRNYNFIIAVGFFVYFSTSFFSILMYEKILTENNGSIWIIHNAANALKNILFGLAIMRYFKNSSANG